MPTNQLPFSEDSHQPGPAMPKKVRFTNQLFPPRINSESDDGQLRSQPLPPPNDPPPSSGFNPELPTNTPVNNQQPFQNNPSQFGGFNAGMPNNNAPQGTQQLSQHNLLQFDGYQMDDEPRKTTTGLLGNPGTGALTQSVGQYSGDTGMLTLNQAVKIVKIPIAGKPGEFKTGILPILSPTQTGALPPPSSNTVVTNKRNGKMILLVLLVVLVLLGSGGYYLLHSAGSSTSTTTLPPSTRIANKNNTQATATVVANATATSGAAILSDPLSYYNSHNWLVGDVAASKVTFTLSSDGYHIRPDNDSSYFGYTFITPSDIPPSYIYNLTMRNVSYDQTNINNFSFYSMIFNYKNYGGGKATFYMFRVNNGVNDNKNISYEFDKFDNRKGDQTFHEIFPDKDGQAGVGKGNGSEFHGQHQANAYSVADKNGTFTLSVNGVKIGTVKDTSFAVGGIGMGVNQAKSEAVFSNLSILSN
jgi:hypothetical protein